MIGKIRGVIDFIEEDKVIVDVNGLGYVVYLSIKVIEFVRSLPAPKEVSFIIETIVRDDAIELYGFSSFIEKSWFLELTKVQGVGAKMAQKILGFFTVEELVKSLIASDAKAFSKISGIGPKLAGRITTELKESPKKLGIDIGSILLEPLSANELLENKVAADALSALANLGYKKPDCLKVINLILKENPLITLEQLITTCLRHLYQK